MFLQFQSTHLREVRLNMLDYILPKGLIFQSTHLREVRRGLYTNYFLHRDFNPRTYERCDPFESLIKYKGVISIHAPTRGATENLPLGLSSDIIISIHAPTRGATVILHKLQLIKTIILIT